MTGADSDSSAAAGGQGGAAGRAADGRAKARSAGGAGCTATADSSEVVRRGGTILPARPGGLPVCSPHGRLVATGKDCPHPDRPSRVVCDRCLIQDQQGARKEPDITSALPRLAAVTRPHRGPAWPVPVAAVPAGGWAARRPAAGRAAAGAAGRGRRGRRVPGRRAARRGRRAGRPDWSPPASREARPLMRGVALRPARPRPARRAGPRRAAPRAGDGRRRRGLRAHRPHGRAPGRRRGRRGRPGLPGQGPGRRRAADPGAAVRRRAQAGRRERPPAARGRAAPGRVGPARARPAAPAADGRPTAVAVHTFYRPGRHAAPARRRLLRRGADRPGPAAT